MRRLIASEFITLDGVIEAPEEWNGQFWNEEQAKYTHEQLRASGALLLGRATYEVFAGAWPSRTDPEGHADRMNSLPKYVVSNTLNDVAWNNSHLLKGDLSEEVARLKQADGQDILIWGSGELVRALTAHRLIDEYRLWVHPIVVGKGKRLFNDGGVPTVLKLSDTRVFSSGVVILSYVPALSQP